MEQPAPPSSRVSLAVAHLSDPGLDPDKQVNEDACAAGEIGLGHLLVVCDGMGGHMGGKEASEAAIRTIFADVESAPAGSQPGAVLKAAIEHAGRVVFELGGTGNNLLRPGSTVVAVLSHAAGSEVAHVGDSRAYFLRRGQIHALTRDHSMVQQMIDAGVLKPEEGVGHPDANKITRALGMTATVEVELRPTPFAHQRGDIFLLASDGLTDLVAPHELLSVTTQAREARGLEFACQQLISMANARGGHDNTTVLLGEIVSCPPCPESKTVIPDESPAAPEPAPATMPDLPTVGGALGPDAAGVSGVHPTMVDTSPDPVMSPAPGPAVPGAPGEGAVGVAAPTWIGDASQDQEPPDYDADIARRRRMLWLVVGAALVLFGLLLVVSSIWWVLAATASISSPDPARDPIAYTLVRRADATCSCRLSI